MSVTVDYSPQRIVDELGGLWHHTSELLRAQTRNDYRMQRMETDIAVLKSDVSVLKSDVAVLKSDVSVLKSDVSVLKSDVAVLKTDVAELKTDVAETKEQLRRSELANERRFNRIDAQLERLVGLVQRSEARRN